MGETATNENFVFQFELENKNKQKLKLIQIKKENVIIGQIVQIDQKL